MKIGMQTWGSRGDVVPFLALGAGLRQAGHDVTLAVTTVGTSDYSALAARAGIDLIIVHPDFDAPSPARLRQIVRTSDPVEEVRLLNEDYFDPAVEDMYEASKVLCADNDVVIGHFWLHTLLTAATLSDVPRVCLHFCPIGVRSNHVPAVGPNLGPWLNRFLWNVGDYVTGRRVFRKANEIRKSEGLRPVRSLQRELFVSEDLTLIAASPLVTPRQPDWGENIQVTGYFRSALVNRHAETSRELLEFIESGPAPVYFTFGSCDFFFGEENVLLFLEAIRLTGDRAIVQTMVPVTMEDDEHSGVLFVTEADHSEIFPRCKLVVHHGGAGTTHSAIRSGRPSIVVEHGFDQTYWGKALVGRGVSPRLLHRRNVTPGKLADAMRECESPEISRQARQLGETFAEEDGVRRAVELIGRRFAR